MYFGYEIRYFQCFSVFHAFSNHQLTSKHHQLNRLRIARCLLECDCFDLGRTPLQEFLSRYQPPWSTRRPVANGGDGFEGVGFVWRRDLKFINQVKDVKMNLWCEQDSRQIYGMSAIRENYVQFWSNAFAQWRRQSAKVLLSGTHRRITKGDSTSPTFLEFSFIGGAILALTCFFLSAFKNWAICCSRLHVCSHQTLDQTSILEKWDPFPSQTCQKTKWHLSLAKDDLNHGKYYIHRVHLDFTAAVFLAAVWLWQHFSAREDSSSNTRVFFGFLGIKIKLSLGAWRL